jgi:hypothetical protein
MLISLPIILRCKGGEKWTYPVRENRSQMNRRIQAINV